MWVISKTGFVSLVQDRKDASKVWVRARVKEDIALMFPGHADQIVTKPGADYTFRLLVPREVASMAMWNAVADLDYTSHAKEAMNHGSHPNAERMSAYYSCWTALARMQPFAPYSKVPRAVGGMTAKPTTGRPAFSNRPSAADAGTTGWEGGRYHWDRHPQSTGYVNGEPIDPEVVALIHGLEEGQPDTWEDVPDEAFGLDDADFADLVEKRETERRGPAGKRNPRRRAPRPRKAKK